MSGSAHIRTVCSDLFGPAENQDQLSCDGSFLQSLIEQKRGFLHVHIVGMELYLIHLPDDVTHISGFGGEDGSVV